MTTHGVGRFRLEGLAISWNTVIADHDTDAPVCLARDTITGKGSDVIFGDRGNVFYVEEANNVTKTAYGWAGYGDFTDGEAWNVTRANVRDAENAGNGNDNIAADIGNNIGMFLQNCH